MALAGRALPKRRSRTHSRALETESGQIQRSDAQEAKSKQGTIHSGVVTSIPAGQKSKTTASLFEGSCLRYKGVQCT